VVAGNVLEQIPGRALKMGKVLMIMSRREMMMMMDG
jgi:hypothetical protein